MKEDNLPAPKPCSIVSGLFNAPDTLWLHPQHGMLREKLDGSEICYTRLLPLPLPAATSREDTPSLMILPDHVEHIGQVFIRDGQAFQLIGEPSSDGEVGLCRKLFHTAEPADDQK